MFLDLDLIGRFHIEYDVLCRWLLSVKKNYRNVTYHNWRHAFNVAQMMFSIVTVYAIIPSDLISRALSHASRPSLQFTGNPVVESSGGNRSTGLDHGLPLSRLGSQGDEQLFPNQVRVEYGHVVARSIGNSREFWSVSLELPPHWPNCTRRPRWSDIISTSA